MIMKRLADFDRVDTCTFVDRRVYTTEIESMDRPRVYIGTTVTKTLEGCVELWGAEVRSYGVLLPPGSEVRWRTSDAGVSYGIIRTLGKGNGARDVWYLEGNETVPLF